MARKYTDNELEAARKIIQQIENNRITLGIDELQILIEEVYAAIPDKRRISRGITWVLLRIAALIMDLCQDDEQIKLLAVTIYGNLETGNKSIGVPIFMFSEYGTRHPLEVLDLFLQAGDSDSWEVREFAAGGLQKITKLNKDVLHTWLVDSAQNESPNIRRMVSESLRPVALGRWLFDEPEYSLRVLRHLFKEPHIYPRTSVGNNLSDLSKRHPEMILQIVADLVSSADKNSSWIAYRACRNLVKENTRAVLDVLGIDEYKYKKK